MTTHLESNTLLTFLSEMWISDAPWDCVARLGTRCDLCMPLGQQIWLVLGRYIN